MTMWGVVETVRLVGRSHHRLRLVVTEVPDDVRRLAVMLALANAGYDAKFSSGGLAWANHRLLTDGRWPPMLQAGAEAVTTVTWTQLLEQADQARSLTLKLAPADYASLALAADAAGEQLYPWCRQALLAAAGGPS